MLSQESIGRFTVLRAKLFAAIHAALERDGHCKSYEGTFAIFWPNYFEESDKGAWYETGEPWGIRLDCYVVGPRRHYDWWGKTFEIALAKAEEDITKWIEDEARDEKEEDENWSGGNRSVETDSRGMK